MNTGGTRAKKYLQAPGGKFYYFKRSNIKTLPVPGRAKILNMNSGVKSYWVLMYFVMILRLINPVNKAVYLNKFIMNHQDHIF